MNVYLRATATNFESVKRSLLVAGKTDAKTRVKRADVERRMFARPDAVRFFASWYERLPKKN